MGLASAPHVVLGDELRGTVREHYDTTEVMLCFVGNLGQTVYGRPIVDGVCFIYMCMLLLCCPLEASTSYL